MEQKEMSFYDHLQELRKRILFVAIFFVIAMIAGFFLAPTVISYLQSTPEAHDFPMNAFKLTDPLRVYMTFAFYTALVLVFPLLLYQIWSFVSPGLLDKERKVTLSYIPVSMLLFVGGLSFSYFVLFPFVIQFLKTLAERLNITEQYGINEYFSFLFQMTIPFGFLFQLPVVVMFLTRLGIVTPSTFVRIRKYAYFVLLVIAAFITPPEVVSHVLVTVPLFILYEFSIVISKVSYRKVLKAEKELKDQWEKEDQERQRLS